MSSLTKVNTEDLQMRGYVDLQQSIFDVKSAIFGKKMPEKVDEPEETEEPSSGNNFKVLTKQSLKLRNTAVLIHKQALMEFKYEKRLFGNIKLSNAPKKYQTSATFRKRLKLKKDSEKKLDTSSLRNLLDDLINKFLRKGWLKIKRGIKRLIGKKGIKFIRSIRKLFRKIKINYKLFRRFAFKPFRQARRFVQSLPKKTWNLSKNLVKKGVSTVKTQLLKRGGLKGIKSSASKTVTNVGKTLLKRFKLFYKLGPGKFIKKIPLIGALIDFAINYFVFKEPLKKALFKAVGAGIGTMVGGVLAGKLAAVVTTGVLAPVLGPFAPVVGAAIGGSAGKFVGGVLGGIAGDFIGGLFYKLFSGGGAKDGAKVKKPQFVLVGEGGEDEWIVPKSKLGWWIAPLVGDIIQDTVDSEQKESEKIKRTVDKIQTGTTTNNKSTDIKKEISVVKSQENIVKNIQPVNNTVNNTTITNPPKPANIALNTIEPDPEPDYSEVIPSLLEQQITVVENEPELLPFPIPMGGGSEKDTPYPVWGRRVVGN